MKIHELCSAWFYLILWQPSLISDQMSNSKLPTMIIINILRSSSNLKRQSCPVHLFLLWLSFLLPLTLPLCFLPWRCFPFLLLFPFPFLQVFLYFSFLYFSFLFPFLLLFLFTFYLLAPLIVLIIFLNITLDGIALVQVSEEKHLWILIHIWIFAFFPIFLSTNVITPTAPSLSF